MILPEQVSSEQSRAAFCLERARRHEQRCFEQVNAEREMVQRRRAAQEEAMRLIAANEPWVNQDWVMAARPTHAEDRLVWSLQRFAEACRYRAILESEVAA